MAPNRYSTMVKPIVNIPTAKKSKLVNSILKIISDSQQTASQNPKNPLSSGTLLFGTGAPAHLLRLLLRIIHHLFQEDGHHNIDQHNGIHLAFWPPEKREAVDESVGKWFSKA